MNAWHKAARRLGNQTSRVASCPISHGLPTSMLRASFARMCARHQQDEETYCADVCRGKILPRNLTFIETSDIAKIINHQKGEHAMTSRKSGICELCKEDKNTSSCYGRKVCSTCAFTIRDAKLRPELVIGEIRNVWGDKYFPQAVSTGSSILAEELATRDRTIVDLTREVQLRDEQLEQAEASYNGCVDSLSFANARIEELDEKLASMEPLQISGYQELTCDPASRHTALLDLAIDVIAGKVLGIDAERLSALR